MRRNFRWRGVRWHESTEVNVSEPFARIGNNLSADFVNTIVSFDHAGGTLRSAGDVVDFLATTEAISPAEAERVRAQLRDDVAAERFLARALELRDVVRAALTSIERHERLGDGPLASINAILASDAGFEQLTSDDRGYRVERRHVREDPAIALVPVARDIARLLAMPDAPVRQCAGDGCVRHFYDDSRTRRRRWCEMAICGNRAKASAFAERQRAGR
jgi:predicted RNA-binding Zn ribbon-like protein